MEHEVRPSWDPRAWLIAAGALAVLVIFAYEHRLVAATNRGPNG